MVLEKNRTNIPILFIIITVSTNESNINIEPSEITMATTLTTPLLILSIFFIFNSIPIPSSSCPLHQKQALLHFKSTLDAIHDSESSSFLPVELNSWKPNSDCCTWDRLKCSKARAVTELHLYSIVPESNNPVPVFSNILTPLFHIQSLKLLDIAMNSLLGEIPRDGFRNLTELVHLDMMLNNFNGSIPSQLLQLPKLQYLDLSVNPLLRTLGPEVGSFRSLTTLRLSFNNFQGPIPPQVFELDSLRILDLSNNLFQGVLSPEVGKLRNLERLYLDRNILSGIIPKEIGNLTKLTELYLTDNHFSGEIPASVINLKEMVLLDLSNNSFSSQIPSAIGRLPNMTTLDLSKNELTGPIPSSLQNVSKLETLRLQHNKLAGDIPTWLFNIKSLRGLFIGGNGNSLTWNNNTNIVPRCSLQQISMTSCRLSGQIPKWISSQKELTFLDLSMNQLEGKFPFWLAEMDMEGIVLSDNKLTGSIPPRLFESLGLKLLALSRNNFSGELPENIGNASTLSMLLLSGNNFSGNIPRSVSNRLQVLDLSRNRFSGDNFFVLGDKPLPYIDLSYNEFFGKIPMTFSSETRVLSLGGNKFSGDLPSNLSNLVSLESLDLHGNDITGNFQDVLPQIPTLQVLNLRDNSLKGFIPRTISNLTSLRILDLSGNNLTGSIPQEIGNLTRMIETPHTKYVPFDIWPRYMFIYDDFLDKIEFQDLVVNWKNSFQGLSSHSIGIYSFMDLSDNRFSGEIPASLGNLESLKVLNISYNNISGLIPVSFGNLKDVESLDLSHNKISGSIPQSLVKLDQLAILDVSNNRLTGKIPTGWQMNTMNEVKFFANNSGLCGMQIMIKCPEDIPPTPKKETEEEDEKLSWMLWEGTWFGFPWWKNLPLVHSYCFLFHALVPRFTCLIWYPKISYEIIEIFGLELHNVKKNFKVYFYHCMKFLQQIICCQGQDDFKWCPLGQDDFSIYRENNRVKSGDRHTGAIITPQTGMRETFRG
uniref:Leucine-rich repeat-containing N-terminal plant-type domain-containing protein n=1 Tax=Lactuca sativa TaxID=4236 RepID=A0A9R1V6Z6_LACSA|nr:hypothetical protein LSAT_V11C600319320 [Lactuca sativa]